MTIIKYIIFKIKKAWDIQRMLYRSVVASAVFYEVVC